MEQSDHPARQLPSILHTGEQTMAYAAEKSRSVDDPVQAIELCLRRGGLDGAVAGELARETSLLPDEVETGLQKLRFEGVAVASGHSRYLHREAVLEAAAKILSVLEEYHEKEPQSPGALKPRLIELGQLPPACFEAAMGVLMAEGSVAFCAATRRFSRSGWQPALPEALAAVCERVEGLFRERLFNPPGASETGLDERSFLEALKVLKEFGRLVEVPGGVVFHGDAVSAAAVKAVEHIKREGRLESVDFKYLIGSTRKYALPLLDHLDAIGVTRRVGNTRFLKNPKT